MKKKFRIGLKLGSTNLNYIEEAKNLYKKNIYYYIELFIFPGSFNKYINYWKDLDIPFVIHAPHFMNGLNFSDKNKKENNLNLAVEAIKFADELQTDIIIFHPGVNGNIDETIRQLNLINDKRIVIENKPYYGLNNSGICVGNSVNEIKYIIENAKVGFCLDIGHAIYAANAKKVNPLENIKNFIELKPKIYHLSDGDYNGLYDKHLSFGEGNYPIKDIMKIISSNSLITIETNKKYDNKLDDFIEEIKYLNNIKD